MSKHDLTSKAARRRLHVRTEPYWLDLGKGSALGFRRGPDTWVARWHDPATRRHLYHALAGDITDPTDYAQARDAAERWWKTLSDSATVGVQRGTVADALKSYVADKRAHGINADDIERRIGLTVTDTSLAALRVEQVTRAAFMAWRKSLTEGRVARTVNREVRCIVAGLNWAVEQGGYAGNPLAWKLKALADDVDAEPEKAAVFLGKGQRAALIAAAPADLALFLTGLDFTGARPGELAATIVADFDAKLGKLTLRSKKGNRSKPLVVAVELESAAVEFFKAQCKDKLPRAPIFTDARKGAAWHRHDWAKAFRATVDAANDPPKESGKQPLKGDARIPREASAYSFRHAHIAESLAVLDPVTVAKLHLTSVAMIEKTYHKFVGSRVREALDALRAAE